MCRVAHLTLSRLLSGMFLREADSGLSVSVGGFLLRPENSGVSLAISQCIMWTPAQLQWIATQIIFSSKKTELC